MIKHNNDIRTKEQGEVSCKAERKIFFSALPLFKRLLFE